MSRGAATARVAQPRNPGYAGLADGAASGPGVVPGVGGVTVEVFKDVAYALAPLDADDARRLLLSLRSSVHFTGRPTFLAAQTQTVSSA